MLVNVNVNTAEMQISINKLLNIKMAIYHYFKTMDTNLGVPFVIC